jgi:hypothetical protein
MIRMSTEEGVVHFKVDRTIYLETDTEILRTIQNSLSPGRIRTRIYLIMKMCQSPHRSVRVCSQGTAGLFIIPLSDKSQDT